jgi:hypothetical protein
MHDGIAARDKPGGAVTETIGHRIFADVYDIWPLSGTTKFYRIGNRHPFGWVGADDVLPWDTRLALKSADSAKPTSPVIGWDANRIQIAVWDEERPWEKVQSTEWVQESSISRPSRGVFLSRDEVLSLLQRSTNTGTSESSDSLRLKALLGRLGQTPPLAPAAIDSARKVLPEWAFARTDHTASQVAERLSRVNEEWTPDAAWAGFAFQFVPLDALP